MKRVITSLATMVLGLALVACGTSIKDPVERNKESMMKPAEESSSAEESTVEFSEEPTNETTENDPVTLPEEGYEVDTSLREMLEAHITEIEEAGFMIEPLLEKEWDYEASLNEYSCKFTQGDNDYVIIVNPDKFDIAKLPALGGTSSGTESKVETHPDATTGTRSSSIDFASYADVYPEGDERLWKYEAVDVTGFVHMDTLIEKIRKDNGWTTVEIINEFFDEVTTDAEFEIVFDGTYHYGFAIDNEGTRYVKNMD